MSNVITLFANAEATRPQELIEFNEYLYLIKNGHWQDEVINFRTIQDPEERKAAKRKIIAVTPSGEFTGRGQAGLKKHSGLICIDVDDKDMTIFLIKLKGSKTIPLSMPIINHSEGSDMLSISGSNRQST